MRPLVLAAFIVLIGLPAPARAEWQIRPFLGAALGKDTTFTPGAAGGPKLVYGATAGFLGEVLGVEADFSRWSGFLKDDQTIVTNSAVTAIMGNVTIAMPRRLTEYTLRPYFGGGAGLMRVSIEQTVRSFNSTRNMTGVDVGGGVTGFLTRRVGLNWDLRHFRGHRSDTSGGVGFSIGPEQLSYWRANMALAIRY
jgi:hypothetical protein